MPDPSLSEKLAQYLTVLQFDQIPAAVVDSAKLHILDTLGCLLAGSRLEPGRLAYDLAATTSGGGAAREAILIGTAKRVSLLDAVQAMATAAHCGELDDIHGGAGICIGAMIVPALLALAEKQGGSGRDFVAAAIAGYETLARVGLSIDAPKLFARGWWPSTVCGALGVAAAGARLLAWPAEKMVNALGIASLNSGGMLTGGQEGATARHLAFGRAAQGGVLALLASEQGLTGPKRALEDPRGFCMTLCAEPKWELLQRFDNYFLPEVAFKPYPCARQLHAGVEALLRILERTSLAPSTIAAIELSLPTQNAGMMNRPAISTSHAANVGSGQYVMAVTALRAKIDLQSFESEFLRSAEVHRLMGKVTVSPSAELDRHYPKYWPGRVAVTLNDGKKHSEEIIAPKGDGENPMSRLDVEEKFIGLAAAVLGEAKARSVIDEVQSLESRNSLAPLLGALS